MKKFLKYFTAAVVSTLCIFSATACNNTGKSTLIAKPATPVTVSYSEKNEEGFVSFRQKVDGFASRFAAAAYSEYDKSGNFTVSPVSVYMALSLAAECSGGTTKNEILSALGVSYEELIANISKLYCSLNAEYTVPTYLGERLQSKLQLGNSIWIQDGVSYNKSCVDSLAEKFYCYSYYTDFIGDNANANKAVRSFVKDQTNGLIDKDFNLSDETFFALINTLYLKDVWNTDGDDLSFTQDEYVFTNRDGSEKSGKLLSGYYKTGRAYEGDNFTTFYTTTQHNFKIKFIVPKDGYTVDEVFTAENIETVNSITDYNAYDEENLLCYHTRCFFPEYKASYDNDVKEILKQYFGINTLFDRYDCNFSNLTEELVYCNEVRHATQLEVNKKGIEGAAVTVIDMAGAAGPGDYQDVYENFVVDRAFGFVLTDLYDVTLFSGVVSGI